MKYIDDDHDNQARKTEEFMDEFKTHLYPAYASYGFTFAEAFIWYKLNQISNLLAGQDGDDEPDDEEKWKFIG